MPTISIGTLRYDIISDTTRFVKGIKATAKQKKEADRVFREGLSPMEKHNHALIRMYSLYKKGMITKEQTLHQQKKIKKALFDEQYALRMAGADLKKYAGSHAIASKGLAAHTARLNQNTAAKVRNRAAGGGARMDNVGGSIGSAAGFGGSGAGLGRLMGYGAVYAGIGGTLAMMGKMIKETAILETALVDMQVIMGDDAAGTALVNNLREIARTTPLTSKALIKGAQTLLGYGLSAEGLEDTMYRIGEIAGGDAERMDSLTRAFAQVQSAGKLMGQEMLQLVNAGFPVAEIAKAAGVSMEDFRKEMEAGNIKASHLTEAMINLTAAGGMMEGRLARQADTINGKWITAMGGIDQQFAETGEHWKGFTKDAIDFFGEFGTEFIKGFDYGTVLINETADALEPLKDGLMWVIDGFKFLGNGGNIAGPEAAKDTLGMDGKKLSGYKQAIRDVGDAYNRMLGYTQEQIDADRAGIRAIQMKTNALNEEKKAREKVLEGKKRIKESMEKETSDFVKDQKKKTDAIKKEMAGEESRKDILDRQQAERFKAYKEQMRLRRGGADGAATDYLNAIRDRQRAELALYDQNVAKAKAEADAKAKLEADKKAEDERFKREKEFLKKASEAKKKLINEEHDLEKAIAGNYGSRGAMTGMDSYSASAAMLAEYDQNSIVNAADEKREQQLEDLKLLEKQGQEKLQRQHDARMKKIEDANNKGTP